MIRIPRCFDGYDSAGRDRSARSNLPHTQTIRGVTHPLERDQMVQEDRWSAMTPEVDLMPICSNRTEGNIDNHTSDPFAMIDVFADDKQEFL